MTHESTDVEQVALAEQWLPVVGWEGYIEVSSHGRIRSLSRTITDSLGRIRRHRGRVLKQTRHLSGYPMVMLNGSGRSVAALVHRLVIEAFKGSAPPGRPYCLHSDGSRDNNRPDNLRYGTAADNQNDRRNASGRIRRPVTGWRRAARVKELVEIGRPEASIAVELGLSLETVHRIATNVWYKNVPLPPIRIREVG